MSGSDDTTPGFSTGLEQESPEQAEQNPSQDPQEQESSSAPPAAPPADVSIGEHQEEVRVENPPAADRSSGGGNVRAVPRAANRRMEPYVRPAQRRANQPAAPEQPAQVNVPREVVGQAPLPQQQEPPNPERDGNFDAEELRRRIELERRRRQRDRMGRYGERLIRLLYRLERGGEMREGELDDSSDTDEEEPEEGEHQGQEEQEDEEVEDETSSDSESGGEEDEEDVDVVGDE